MNAAVIQPDQACREAEQACQEAEQRWHQEAAARRAWAACLAELEAQLQRQEGKDPS